MQTTKYQTKKFRSIEILDNGAPWVEVLVDGEKYTMRDDLVDLLFEEAPKKPKRKGRKKSNNRQILEDYAEAS